VFQSSSGHFGVEKIVLPLMAMEPKFLCRLASSLLTVATCPVLLNAMFRWVPSPGTQQVRVSPADENISNISHRTFLVQL
jgi:hypothetical protein